MMKQNIDIVVISISSPILVGIYRDKQLHDTISSDGKTSDILPLIFKKILDRYNIETIYYVNGPGSYMAIKVAYIFLKTISIMKNCNLRAIIGFELNNRSPIKALGKKYFIYNQNSKQIDIEFLSNQQIEPFRLPNSLIDLEYSENGLPNYNLPAV